MRAGLLAAACAVLMTVGGSAAAQAPAEATGYGPGVEVLQTWFDTGTRGDLAGDSALLASAEQVARTAIERPKVTLQGPAVVAFAVSTPSGAVAYVVQHATDTRGGQTTVAQGVSLPAGAVVWFDDAGEVVHRVVDFPVSQAESATGPEDGPLTTGVWTTSGQRHFVVFDTGYPTSVRDGVLGPRYSSPRDLVRITERRRLDIAGAGFTVITPPKGVLPGTAQVSIKQPEGLSNHPVLFTPPSRSHIDEGQHDWFPDELDFESSQASAPFQIRPFDAAYGGHEATKLAKKWAKERISMPISLWGSPLQARLPSGARVLMRNVVFGKAYVALVKFPSGRVVGTRCTSPGPVLTASCLLPRDLGRLFAVDETFSWQTRDGRWVAATTPRHVSVTYAAIVPAGATIRVTPDGTHRFTLYP